MATVPVQAASDVIAGSLQRPATLQEETGRFHVAGATQVACVTKLLSLHGVIPVAIQMPQRATLEVVDTEPVTKGQTASSSYKPAMLSNGVRTLVPPHIGTGTRIVIMTEDGSYAERAKD